MVYLLLFEISTSLSTNSETNLSESIKSLSTPLTSSRFTRILTLLVSKSESPCVLPGFLGVSEKDVFWEMAIPSEWRGFMRSGSGLIGEVNSLRSRDLTSTGETLPRGGSSEYGVSFLSNWRMAVPPFGVFVDRCIFWIWGSYDPSHVSLISA